MMSISSWAKQNKSSNSFFLKSFMFFLKSLKKKRDFFFETMVCSIFSKVKSRWIFFRNTGWLYFRKLKIVWKIPLPNIQLDCIKEFFEKQSLIMKATRLHQHKTTRKKRNYEHHPDCIKEIRNGKNQKHETRLGLHRKKSWNQTKSSFFFRNATNIKAMKTEPKQKKRGDLKVR